MVDSRQSGLAKHHGDFASGPSNAAAERLSIWWWLGFPIAFVVSMFLFGQMAPEFYRNWIQGERGLLELSQAALMVAAMVLALRFFTLRVVRRTPSLLALALLTSIGSFYVAGEELSWGQQLFFWSTPENWAAINDQGETNLHNVSSWFDQKPRTLLEIGVIIGGIILPLAALYSPAIRRSRIGIFIPPFLCLPSAVLAEATRLLERIAEATGGDPRGILLRPSEHQEFYFYLFILFYLIVLGQRLRNLEAQGA